MLYDMVDVRATCFHLLKIVSSDFILIFRKLPCPSHLGKHFIKIGKISAKIYEIGK